MSAELSRVFEGFTEDKFCIGCYAVDESGKWVESHSEKAVRFCAVGWMIRDGSKEEGNPLYKEILSIAKQLGYRTVSAANDHLGYDFINLIREGGDK